MNKKGTKLYSLLLFIISLGLLTYCLPGTSEDEMSYQVGKPWNYPLLTAPFDIPVHIDSVRAEELRDSVRRNFEPVMKIDPGVKTHALDEADKKMQDVGIGRNVRKPVLAALENVYNHGIVTTEVYEKISAGELPMVRFIENNTSKTAPTANYLSPRQAYLMLDSLISSPWIRIPMQQLSLASVLQPNIVADTASTTKLMNEAFQRVLIPTGVVQQGERIIDKGDVVTLQQATVLDTYKAMMADRAPKRKSNQWFILLGKVIYVIIALICLYSYLFYFRRDYYDDWKVMSFLMLMVTGFALLCYALQGAIVDGIYLVPMVIVPLLVLIFLDSRTAIYCNFITIMLATLVASIPLEFIVMQLAAGFLGVATTHELTRRSQLIRTAVLTFLIYALVVISVSLMDTGALERATLRTLLFLGINAVFISFGYVFMFIIEKVFGFTSRVTLVELSDINNPLLRRLSEECPGTFQHSMAVSNLASAAAASIGANVQLVRTGALYHDIGKIKNPAFFTENQSGINPHDALDPVQSARIITGHIRQGLSMAEKAKLPKSIRDFISQHHGRGVARYFYNTFCNQHPGQEVDAEPFTYPGPNPQSREASVVMMADSVEAASRSLTDHSPEAIRALVDRIIDAQIKDGLHNESDLSFRDVEKIKETFVRRLANIYHSRIAYPELNKNVPKS